jgi:hypothetical protein
MLLPTAVGWVGDLGASGAEADDAFHSAAEGGQTSCARLRLGDMDSHLHCSVIGTCLSTAELRKLMARFIHLDGASDLDVHHDAVRMAGGNPDVARALTKALDRRHEGSLQRFARAKDSDGVAELWRQSLKSGEIPGAYWAVLTHRRASNELRQEAFGDVHMLSHLVGAANRADIRHLVALEQENADIRERADRQQERLREVIGERDRRSSECDLLRARVTELQQSNHSRTGSLAEVSGAAAAALSAAVALQTGRREAAEARVVGLESDLARLEEELEHLRAHADEMARELAAAETELREGSRPPDAETSSLRQGLDGRRILYVGGRPSSIPAIRDLVLRHGGEYRRHDGGMEDRKGSLAAALGWADLVVFPVDCVDHDSALILKRSCLRQGKPFLPLRSASVASFAATIVATVEPPSRAGPPCGGPCLGHG